jgi:predicted HNH restriction endonuclease
VAGARKLGNSSLKCEVPGCGFDFEAVYGELGRDYAQVHHLKPLGDRTTPSETKLNDLAIVCANCHAMIHRGGKCRPLDKLIQTK